MRQILILILFSLLAFVPSVYGGFWDSAVEKVREVTGPKEAVKTAGKADEQGISVDMPSESNAARGDGSASRGPESRGAEGSGKGLCFWRFYG